MADVSIGVEHPQVRVLNRTRDVVQMPIEPPLIITYDRWALRLQNLRRPDRPTGSNLTERGQVREVAEPFDPASLNLKSEVEWMGARHGSWFLLDVGCSDLLSVGFPGLFDKLRSLVLSNGDLGGHLDVAR